MNLSPFTKINLIVLAICVSSTVQAEPFKDAMKGMGGSLKTIMISLKSGQINEQTLEAAKTLVASCDMAQKNIPEMFQKDENFGKTLMQACLLDQNLLKAIESQDLAAAGQIVEQLKQTKEDAHEQYKKD